QRSHLLPLPLCIREAWRVGQIASTLPGGFVDVDVEIFVLARGALRLLRTRTATFVASDVGMRSIPDIQTDEVESLTRVTEIAVAFRNKGETLGTVEWVVLAESAVPGAVICKC